MGTRNVLTLVLIRRLESSRLMRLDQIASRMWSLTVFEPALPGRRSSLTCSAGFK